MKSFFSIAIAATLIVTAATVASCDREDTKEREQCERLVQNGYSVTACCDKNGTVSITSEPWEYSDRPSETITIYATANSGYRFVEWQTTIDGITVSGNTNNPVTFGMYHDADAVVWKAIFVPAVTLPEKIIVSQSNNRETKYDYRYDSQNRFTEIRGLYSIGWRDEFSYNADGDLVKYYCPGSPSARSTGATFSKNGNKITFVIRYHPTVPIFGSVNGELELNAHGLPVKLTYEEAGVYSSTGSNSRTNKTVNLTWQNGNLIKTDWVKDWEGENVIFDWEKGKIDHVEKIKGSSTGTVTYTHDDKKTPFYYCNTPKWFLWFLDYDWMYALSLKNCGYNENNVKTVKREEDEVTRIYEYTYNDDGFPVMRTWEQNWELVSGGYETITVTETYTYIQE